MTAESPKVALAVHGRYHAFSLASELHRRNALIQVATTYPSFIARRFLSPDIALATAPWLEAWRRMSGKVPLIPPPDPGISKAFGRFAARTLPDGANLLVGWSSAILEAIAPARARDMKVIVERGSTHISHQTEVLRAAAERFGLPLSETPTEIIERELAEYEDADAIAVPTRHAAQTFIERGIPAEKLLVIPYGTDTRTASPDRAEDKDGPVRILFVGSVGLRKGLPWLLRAVDALKGKAVLDVAGPMEPGMDAVLASEPTTHAVFHGAVSTPARDRLYDQADLFCLPSLEEGFGLVLLEAMAAGLPIVASDVSGGTELIADDDTGLLIPPCDTPALTEALARLTDDTALRDRQGHAAREKVHNEFSLSRYGDRVMDAYTRILTEGRAP